MIILALMSVPLAAIASRTYLKKREIEARSGGLTLPEARALRAEVAELRQRVETLETIATTGDGALVPASRALEELQLASRRSRAG